MLYPKIQSIKKRNPENNNKTFLDDWATPEFELLQNIEWEWAEKVDGTNVRIIYENGTVRFGGRTNNAQMPIPLLDTLAELFPVEKFEFAGDTPLYLFGEGFGNKIQKRGKDYKPNGVGFVLFDAYCSMWLRRDSVEAIGKDLGIQVAPIVLRGSINEAIDLTAPGFNSAFGTAKAEGLVGRPRHELRDRRGNRIITKVKTKDFTP